MVNRWADDDIQQSSPTFPNTPRYLDEYGTPVTPFASFVRASPSLLPAATSVGGASFSRYCDLSPELVLTIYEFCDAATLFQLMRACPVGREAARKLFWAHPDPWYRVSAQWLIEKAGFSGSAWHCPQFAQAVQQLEVAFQYQIGRYFRPSPCLFTYRSFYNPSCDRPLQAASRNPDLLERVKDFWKTVCLPFPAVRRVVVSSPVTYNTQGNRLVPELPALLKREKPPHITLYLSFSQLEHKPRPSVLRSQKRVMLKCVGTAQEMLAPEGDRQRVLLPARKFLGSLARYSALLCIETAIASCGGEYNGYALKLTTTITLIKNPQFPARHAFVPIVD